MSPVSPDEVRSQSFTRSKRGGYEPAEVDAFLTKMARELETMQRSAKPTDPAEALGAEVAQIMGSARSAADSLKDRSNAEAEQIRKRAAAKALEVRRSAQEEAEKALSQAQAEAQQALTKARTEAERTLTSAQSQAERTLNSARAEAEQTLTSAREAADKLRTETEAETTRRRDNARREASALLDDAVAKHDRLVSHEEQLRLRVDAAHAALEELRSALDADEAAAEDAAASRPGAVPGAGTTDERVWTPHEIATRGPKPVPAGPPS